MNIVTSKLLSMVPQAVAIIAIFTFCSVAIAESETKSKNTIPSPLLNQNTSADWWFVFKFNAAQFSGCADKAKRSCPFGGDVQDYKYGYSQQYIYASSENQNLQKGNVCIGDTEKDPLGATFDTIYNGDYYYVVWNDQFYEQPFIEGCKTSCSAPWGHAKGVVAWDSQGNGVVIQVTTPAWPGSGNTKHPRAAGGNTLGCVSLDDDIAVAQHFFSLKLNTADLKKVLSALANSSVVTDVTNPQLVNNGGPKDVQSLVSNLGVQSKSTSVTHVTLSSGVELISKPSSLHVPPWQLVSAQLDSTNLRTATWWAKPKIPSTSKDTPIECWDETLGKPGAVAIATSGSWQGQEFSLKGGLGNKFNHAKFAVDDIDQPTLAIFGDMNQQGAIAPGSAYPKQKCSSSQNGRGGTFYVVHDKKLAANVASLIKGDTAPLAAAADNN